MTEIRDFERRFAPGGGSIELDAATRYKVLAAFDGYLETLPESSLARPDSYRVKDVVGRRGIGIGSAGLPSYNILLEGHSDALENDVVIYIKQAQTPAVSRHITDPAIRDYFQHEGHRTVISQRALQAHADPWLGWTELDGAGQLVAEVSPYAVDLDWGDIDDPEEIAAVVADLGRATATMHAAADDQTGESLVPFSTERAIDAAIAADEDGFAAAAGRLRAQLRRTRACRPPDLRGPVPQRPDPGSVTGTRCRRYGRSQGSFRGPLQARVTHSPRYGHIRDPASERYARRCSRHCVVTLSTASHVLLSRVPLPLNTVAAVAAAVFVARLRAGRPGARLRADRRPADPAGAGRRHRLHHRPARLLRPGGRPGRRPAALGRLGRAVRRRRRRHAAGPGGRHRHRPARGCSPHADPATAWLLLAAHVGVGLLAAAWLRRGERALAQLLRAVAASRSGRCCWRSPR